MCLVALGRGATRWETSRLGLTSLVKDGSSTTGLAMTVGGNGGGIMYGMVKLEGGNAG